MKVLYISLVSVILLTWIAHGVILPPWQNPDEPTHFEYLKILLDQKTFSLKIQPNLSVQQAIIKSMDRHRYWEHVQIPRPDPLPGSFAEIPFLFVSRTQIGITPPFYYVLVSFLLSPAREKSLETQFYLVRGISLGFGLVTLLLSYLIARELLRNESERIAAVLAFIGLLPQFDLVTTSVNPDSLANLLATGVIYLLILLIRDGISMPRLILLSFGILLGLMTKRTVFMTLPLAGIALLLVSWNHLRHKGLRFWVLTLYKVVNVVLLLAGLYALGIWYFPEAIQTLSQRVIPVLYAIPVFLSKFLFQPPVPQIKMVLLHLFQSFWYTFGWMKYPLADPWYLGLQILCILSLTGLMIFWIRVFQRKIRMETWQLQGLLILIFACFLVFFGTFLDSGGFTIFTQGRYLFPAISAFAILGVLGLYQLVPKRLYRPFTMVFLLGFLTFNMLTFWRYTLPTFYDFPFQVVSHQLAFDQTVGEIFGDKKIGQTFRAEAKNLTGIEVFLATYARTNTFPIIFHLKETPDAPTDLFTQTLPAWQIRNNAYHRFRFPVIPDSQGKSYYFSLESPESRPGNAITAWRHSEDRYKNGSLWIHGVEEKGDLTFRTVYESSLGTFVEGLIQNKPFPLNRGIFYLILLSIHGFSVLSLVISLKVFRPLSDTPVSSPSPPHLPSPSPEASGKGEQGVRER
ncbi:MAG TPA: hypothetical protein VNM22_08995 [Candidatus Limnocylindrales bacterium]|nr:hypothetical protein [Candidatus Limnocylindrales bacterium]